MLIADSRKNRRTARKRKGQRGMTILEIMIVLAIIALVMGFLIGPKVMKMFGESKVDIAKLQIKEYSDQAYGLWLRNNPGKACPASLGDLNEYTNRKSSKDGKADITDSWGTEMQMRCPPPPGVVGIGVVSAGADMKFDTSDDLHSWD